MSNPLVTHVERNGEYLFSVYEHWAGGTDSRIRNACAFIASLEKNADLIMLLRQLCTTDGLLGSGCGLLTDRSWFASDAEYQAEKPLIDIMLGHGIPACTNKNNGLIAFTRFARQGLENEACDIFTLDLAKDISIRDLLDHEGSCEEYIEFIRSDYGEDADEETEAVMTAPVLPSFAVETITHENGLDILEKWYAVTDEVFLDNGQVLRVCNG